MMNGKPGFFGSVLGLIGNALIAYGIYKILSGVGCSTNLETVGACTSDIQKNVYLLPLGIVIATVAVFAGGGAPAFLGTFLAVGVGALLASFEAEDSFIPSFGKMFGGIFIAVSLLLIVMWMFGAGWGRQRIARANNLMTTGKRGTGTIANVVDTGVWVNDNPRVHLTVQVQPDDGSAPFTVEKKVTISRFAFPQIGSRVPVWYDPSNPSDWIYGNEAQFSVQSVLGATPGAPSPLSSLVAQATTQTSFGQPMAAPAGLSTAEQLAKLSEMRTSGALSEAEFEAAKGKLLT